MHRRAAEEEAAVRGAGAEAGGAAQRALRWYKSRPNLSPGRTQFGRGWEWEGGFWEKLVLFPLLWFFFPFVLMLQPWKIGSAISTKTMRSSTRSCKMIIVMLVRGLGFWRFVVWGGICASVVAYIPFLLFYFWLIDDFRVEKQDELEKTRQEFLEDIHSNTIYPISKFLSV